MAKRQKLSERADAAAGCPQCAMFLIQRGAGKANHKTFDEAEDYHRNNHNAGLGQGDMVTPKKSKAARDAVSAPPSSATEESHMFQSIFLKVVVGDMPNNNKLDPDQPLVVNDVVTDAVLLAPCLSKMCYEHGFGEAYSEEQNRPVVDALVQGIVSVAAGDEKVIATQSPVRYFIVDENGDYLEVSPPGMKAKAVAERLSTQLSHDERKARRWKKDALVCSEVTTIDKSGQEIKIWVPRVLIEAKGDEAQTKDLYQASTNSWKYILKCLQDRKPVGRVYFEVWGTLKCFYGIQDIFGYVTVVNGIVTEESFKRYQRTIEEHRKLWGKKGFSEESLQRCPMGLQELQAIYDDVADQYRTKFHSELPSKHGIEDFPVGIVYMDPRHFFFPGGEILLARKSAATFVQGHARILAANWVIPTNPADYPRANMRLLENHKKYVERAKNALNAWYIDTERPTKPLPERVVFKTLQEALAGTSTHGIQEADSGSTVCRGGDVSQEGVGDVPGCDVSEGPNVLTSPPVRDVVLTWTNEEVKQLVRLACGSKASQTIDRAVADSEIDGSMLLQMDLDEVKTWCGHIGLQLCQVLRIKRWLVNYN